MKKTMNNYKMIAIGLVTVLTLGLSNATFASNNPDVPSALKFMGNVNNFPVFQLELNNSTNAEFIVTVRDADKKILLSEKIKGEKISRRYKLDSEDMSLITGTTFEVTNKLTKESSVYVIDVNTNRTVVENTIITKL
ncbi:MAG: hypothetical protein JWM28_1985 [Chitinophagaceae bacterium]|nr:hypothetical protein [Chitinophagaceae bacterium]